MTVRIGPPPLVRDPKLAEWLASLHTEMVRLDNENRKLQRDVEIARDNRLIIAAPDGTRWHISIVTPGGALLTTELL